MSTTETPQVPDPSGESKGGGGKTRIPLKTAIDARRQMAKVYRQMYDGRLDPNIGTKHAYVLLALTKMIETADLTARLDALEARANGGRP